MDFSDRAHAQEAVGRFHQQPFKGRALVVNEARAKESRPSFPLPSRASPPLTEGPPALPDEPSVRPGSARRHFGPDANPRQGRKPPSRDSQPERGRGKALRERKGGQFFSGAEDDPDEAAFPAEPLAAQEREPEGGEQP